MEFNSNKTVYNNIDTVLSRYFDDWSICIYHTCYNDLRNQIQNDYIVKYKLLLSNTIKRIH